MARTVVEKSTDNLLIIDVFSRLIQDRIIFINGHIDEELANEVIAQMLYLDSVSKEPINVYINSPGGFVIQGLAIYDVSKLINSPIRTVCIGEAASMGAILMLMGSTRIGLKHSRIMLHEVNGGSYGSPRDLKVAFEEVSKLQEFLYDIVREKTTLTDLDNLFTVDRWYGSTEALELGILTDIL